MTSSIINKLKEKFLSKKVIARVTIFITFIAILSILIYITYDEYRNRVVVQQQKEMLSISKSMSRSIELFINDITESIKVITLDKDFVKEVSHNNDIINDKLKAYYESKSQVIEGVYLYDKNANMIVQYPKDKTNIDDRIQSEINMVVAARKSFAGKEYFDKSKNSFKLNIYEPVFQGEAISGVISVVINLNTIYDRLIAPIQVGEKGYTMVKDQYGIILMHPVKEQIGINVIETRKQMHPDLDFEELEDLIKNQLTGKEGTAIYYSYWWGDNVLKKARKLSAYTPVKLGDYFWVIALTMSYDEIQAPINRFLGIVMGIAALITVIIFMFGLQLIKMKKNREKLEEETKYLKMLNEASEKLRKKEAELYHSHKLKMIGTLAGGIAHDINNLLTPILGYSELLMTSMPKSSEYYEDVEEIFNASKKGKDLVEQVLVFSRKDNGIVKIESININEVLKQTIKLLKVILPKKIIIKENIKENCGCIRANFTQIHQIIFNLCTNAYQAIKGKEGVVDVTLNTIDGLKANEINERLLKERKYVELSIKDTGCGMDEETKSRIFDPFFTTKTIGEGTGLGLFVVQSVIDKYEGVITVESEIEVGSCFKVYLPLIEEEDFSVNSKDNKGKILKNKKRILIVDDNEKIVKMLKKGLEPMGWEVCIETNALRALKLLYSEQKSFDLVITDYIMPDIKGGELAKQIKTIREDIKVILITGYVDESQKDVNNLEFIDAYVSKPIEIGKLSEIIKDMI